MALEASVAERLQELRQWQVAQQEQLLQQQREQREKLTHEQDRTCRALGLSFGDIPSPDKEGYSSRGHATNSENFIKKPLDELAMPLLEYRIMSEEGEDKPSSEEIAGSSGNIANSEEPLTNSSASQGVANAVAPIEAMEPRPVSRLAAPKCRYLLDDTPVPSTKKDFNTLLEEHLKDTTERPNTTAEPGHESNKRVGRPFLRKGQGLSRFRGSSISENPLGQQRSQTRTQPSLLPKTAKASAKNTIRPRRKSSVPRNNPAQNKLSLKDVSPPGRIRRESSSHLACSPWTGEASAGSDRESKTRRELEEVRIFELLEEKAENSSFCSTSSTVVALLRQSVQSTPLKPRRNFNEQWQAPGLKQMEVAAEESSLEEIVRASATNSLPSPSQNGCSNVQNDHELLANRAPAEATSSLLSVERIPGISELDHREIRCELPYGTDCEPDDTENGRRTNDAILRVRFSDYNEYRTIDLADDSTLSTDAEIPTIVYSDDRAWSDCSTTSESSDLDSITVKLPSLEVSSRRKSDFAAAEELRLFGTKTGEGEEAPPLAELSEVHKESASEARRISLLADSIAEDVAAKHDTAENDDLKGEERDDAPVFFKSELLKSRLLELEREIEIFRRENAALAEQKGKQRKEREEWEQRLKVKLEKLAERERSTDEAVQEEKRKLARDKASLEVRLKDAQARAQQSKHERQEAQNLRAQLDELKEEIARKESRWNAALARHRSQQRILQEENSRLMLEIERLQGRGQNGSKVRGKSSDFASAKALRRINERIDRQRRALSSREEDGRTEESTEGKDDCPGASESSRDNFDGSKIIVCEKPPEALKNTGIARRKRALYEDLLKAATVELTGRDKKTAMVIERSDEAGTSGNDGDYRSNIDENSMKETHSSNDARPDVMKTGCLDGHVSLEGSEERKTNDQVPSFTERSSLSRDRNGRIEEHAVKEVQHSDGRREFWYPNGNVRKVSADKSVTKMIYYNGDVRESMQDGSIKYFYAATRTWHTTMPDGLEVLEFPDGQVERRSKNGTIEVALPDGSVRILHADGSERWALPDGTVADTLVDGEKILTLPNGQREVHAKDHKRREYPDGTVKLVYPDGSQETRYANGRIRLKAQDGSLIMDSHHR